MNMAGSQRKYQFFHPPFSLRFENAVFGLPNKFHLLSKDLALERVLTPCRTCSLATAYWSQRVDMLKPA